MEAGLLRNVLLSLTSLLVVAILSFVGLELYVGTLGIEDPEFRYENRLQMWMPDDVVGYRNQPDFSNHAWGSVLVATNAEGFRTGEASVDSGGEAVDREAGSGRGRRRVVGMGDSVAWGTGVDDENSYLGQLASGGDFAVTNAGVVGYSTYQELLFLQTTVLPLGPDVVLINHCENDRLPTEDPFGKAREIHHRYLSRLMEAPDLSFTDGERARLAELLEIFRSAPGVWAALRDWEGESPRARREFLQRIFVELPVQGMAELCRHNGVRLIYLLIPPAAPGDRYREDLVRFTAHLEDQEVEYVDLNEVLETQAGGASARVTPFQPPRLSFATGSMKKLATYRALEKRHEGADFIDQLHPSRRGNRKIADAIRRHLETQPAPRP